MIRDQRYLEIVRRLENPLNPESFERCAQDLLRTIYPTLVPIRGGSDSGMDGVTADLDGKQLVLVATTGAKVKRNLEASLNRMITDGRTCRRIINATCRKLSPTKQQELRDSAKALGFTVVQVYEQAGMADLLRGSPKWCMELLNLSGEAPLLSVIPKSHRPSITSKLIGREADAHRFAKLNGDRLLVGQPGSGKTFVLSTLAKAHGWLFVVTNDLARIADGVISQKPSGLIVDDAQTDPEFLTALVHLRKEAKFDLPIIAACWPGAKDAVVEKLTLTKEHVCELGPLTRPEIAQVLESAGLTRSKRLVFEILNQAEGRPGLAVTLAHLCLQGDESDVREVVVGDILLRSVRSWFEPLIGPLAIDVIAALAVGGRSGMDLESVAQFLSKPAVDVRRAASDLAAGGVIYDAYGRLSVRPPELRHALIRDYFFKGAISLNILPLLKLSPSIADSAEALAESRHYGAAIPNDLLRPLLELANSEKAWNVYAWSGEDESRWVISGHPELTPALTHPTLHYVPELALPFLFAEAIGDNRALHSHPDHSLRLIEDWVQAGLPETGEPIRRRKALFSAAQDWLKANKDVDVGVKALVLSLAPQFQTSTTDPILEMSVEIRSGLLLCDELDEVATLWKGVVETLKGVHVSDWPPVISAVSDWVYPQRHMQRSVPDDRFERMRSIAADMVRSMVELAKSSAGVMHSMAELAEDLGIEINCPTDKDFEILFPSIPDNMEGFQQQHAAVKELARRWSTSDPGETLKRIAHFETEAKSVNDNNRQTPVLAQELASLVNSPIEWAIALRNYPALGDLAAPFLYAAATANQCGWEDEFNWFVSNETSRFATVPVAFVIKSPPEKIVALAINSLTGMSRVVEVMCLRKQLSEEVIKRLLVHPDDLIASFAATGVWTANEKREVPETLKDSWKKAVLRGSPKEYWIGEILKTDSTMARDFLLKQIDEGAHLWSEHDHGVREALKSLLTEHRLDVLKALKPNLWSRDVTALLIGRNIEIFRELLARSDLKSNHRDPLEGRPDEGNWTERAAVALAAGMVPVDIVNGALRSIGGWWGKESEMLSGWFAAFQAIQNHGDEGIRRIAAEGIAIVSRRIETAVKHERDEETFARR